MQVLVDSGAKVIHTKVIPGLKGASVPSKKPARVLIVAFIRDFNRHEQIQKKNNGIIPRGYLPATTASTADFRCTVRAKPWQAKFLHKGPAPFYLRRV